MVFSGKIVNKEEISAIDNIRKYADTISICHTKTTHMFEKSLPFYIQKKIEILKSGTIQTQLSSAFEKHNVYPITEMNELYFSVIGADGSDKVFETNHVAGPFFLLPFCNVYRSVLALKGNKSVVTRFPNTNMYINLLENDFVIFDYNREPHYIFKSLLEDDSIRIVLKLHYIVCHPFLPNGVVTFYKWLHHTYNSFFRFLFINSQIEGSLLSNSINNMTIWFRTFFDIVKNTQNVFIYIGNCITNGINNIIIGVRNFFYIVKKTRDVCIYIGNHISNNTTRYGLGIMNIVIFVSNSEKICMGFVAVLAFLYRIWNRT